MGAYRDQEGQWRYRKRIRLLDGGLTRVKGTPALNTKAAAKQRSGSTSSVLCVARVGPTN